MIPRLVPYLFTWQDFLISNFSHHGQHQHHTNKSTAFSFIRSLQLTDFLLFMAINTKSDGWQWPLIQQRMYVMTTRCDVAYTIILRHTNEDFPSKNCIKSIFKFGNLSFKNTRNAASGSMNHMSQMRLQWLKTGRYISYQCFMSINRYVEKCVFPRYVVTVCELKNNTGTCVVSW